MTVATGDGPRFRMPLRPGSHSAYVRADGRLVVEWYDFGDDAPYESANLLVFDDQGQAQLAAALDLPAETRAQGLAEAVAARFQSYFEVKAFATDQQLRFASEVDFQP
jgi:predicted DNA-binding WGR domain protein